MSGIRITREGFESLKQQLEELKGPKREEVAQELESARSQGDLRENADYHAARDKQGLLEARIKDIENTLASSIVVDLEMVETDKVRFGLIVQFKNTKTEEVLEYQLVGPTESNLEKNKLSYLTPLAKILLNQYIGEAVEFVNPAGETVEYEILDIKKP
jgi:transcription elongation factor GreA